MLLAFHATAPALKGETPPRRVLVAKWGQNENTKGEKVIVNENTARLLPHVNRALGRQTVVLDFQHNTVEGSPEWQRTAEPRPIAARGGVPRVVPGEGLFIEELTWTPEGIASYASGHHPDLSPALKTNEAGEVMFLHSAAACRHGSITDLHLFTAALSAVQLLTFSATTAPISKSMDPKKINLLILGLEDSATDSQIEEAAKNFGGALKAFSAGAASIVALSATVKTQGEAFTALQAKLTEAERGRLVAEALAQGKVIPFGAEFDAMSNPAFAAVLKSLTPGVVPLEKRTPELVKTFSTSLPQGGEDTAALMREAAGIKQEDWDKHAKR